MLSKQFPIPLEKGMTKAAVVAILVGTILIVFVGWKTIGWVLVAYALLTLYLAYHMGAAPCLDDQETGIIIPDTTDPSAVPWVGTERPQPEWMPDHEVQNLAN